MRRAMIKRCPRLSLWQLRTVLVMLSICPALIRDAQGQSLQPLPPPTGFPAAPATPNASSVPAIQGIAVAPHPPAPTMLQVLTSAQRGFCAHVRVSPLGQLVCNMRKPLSVVTGGLVPAEKAPHADEQAQPGPEGTVAQLKAVNLQAPKRRAAVAELQGIDVRYHPEAEAILIAALRADPSECVRYEAALTLTTLPVCTEPISKALQVCLESSSRDGNPAELSQRVRWQAEAALAKCQCCMPPTSTNDKSRPEYPSSDQPSDSAAEPIARMSTSISRVQFPSELPPPLFEMPDTRMIETNLPVAAVPPPVSKPTPSRPTNLLDVFNKARQEATVQR